MLYPEIKSIKKYKFMVNIFLIVTVFVSATLMLINYLLSQKISWSFIAILGIIYLWSTIIFALRKGINLGSTILIHTIQILTLLFFIDFIFGFKKWSFTIGFPIVTMVSNLAMSIITMIKYKKYVKYAIYEMLILLISVLINLVIIAVFKEKIVLNIIALGITTLNFIIVLMLSAKTLKIELQKKFHI